MTIRVALRHLTEYRYDHPVMLGPQTIRLRPAPHSRTPIASYALIVHPKAHFLNWQQDPQSNWLARIVVPEKTDHFSVETRLIAEMDVINPFDFFVEPEVETWPFEYDPLLEEELRPFRRIHESGPGLKAWLETVDRSPQHTVNFLVALNQRLQGEIGYVIRMEPGIQTCDDTLRLKSGSCRDTGWLLVQILRHLGFAARFTSGYLIQLKPDVVALDGPAGASQDFTDLHAWCEVYIPGAGWIGLDPTSGLLTGEGHIPLACAADPQHAAPISGMLMEQAGVTFHFEMSIERIHEDPRVTKPYSEAQWAEIDSLGRAIDAELKAGDVRLTMGGEPTFVSIDDMEAPEWNTEAVGPTKRMLADELIRRLRDRFAPGGVLHYGQGKWYPGESLPRWAFGLYWRGDGMPIWRDAERIAREQPARTATFADAQAFAAGVARRLDVADDFAIPAYEDPAYYTQKADELPPNVTPADSKLENPEDNARLKAVYTRGVDAPVSMVLPIQRWNAQARKHHWRSEKWKLRKERLYLAPGDSPAGLRLPIGSLPWVPPAAFPYVVPQDPFEERGPLPTPTSAQPTLQGEPEATTARQPVAEQELGGDVVRTAMAFEPRNGKLCVFMPPTETADDYLEILAAVEDTAEETGIPIHVEGYTPPHDDRLNVIKVTPDPGVIEVNIHPAASWDEQVAITRTIYEEARLTRLGTDKYMIDGRHTGTGGGNHIVLGGRKPADSPFLRRPDLLASLIRFWQNHPSISYLFSGLFIGPTSQAPRVDEARHDSLYELEIALKEVPAPGEGVPPPPWLVDRLFRNLLIDVTGNTHRAEICIDKLYNPDSSTGRLGLVEFRGFEMPPHAEMSLAQGLFLRALIARFWKTPYREGFVRWGTSLHDRFMLPHFVRADFADVITDLNAHGYALKAEWFAPHFEFRFPVYGRIERQGVELELRQALEPWNVLGETGAAGGTVRYVDSSVERLQVRLTGATPERHAVTVNGRVVPLAPTDTKGELVAGVRFRAWAAAHALHPTIKPHAPLLIELVDRWTKRSMGGCTYHVAHPGGRNFETFPVNSYEAEGRRLARFEPRGVTFGRLDIPNAEINPDFPLTLDLRR